MSAAHARTLGAQPSSPADLHRRIRAALGRGETSYVRAVLDDPETPLDDHERASYRRLFSFSARLRTEPSADPREESAVQALRRSAAAVWVALDEGREVARGPVLAVVLAEARALGAVAPRVVRLPRAERARGATP